MPRESPARLRRTKRRTTLQRKKAPVKAEGIRPSRAIEASYFQALRVLVRKLEAQVKSKILPLLDRIQAQYIQDSAGSAKGFVESAIKGLEQTPILIEQAQRRIAARMANSAEVFNRSLFIQEINQAAGVSLRNVIRKEGVSAQIGASVQANVGLIKSIPEQYHGKLRKIINEGIDRGDDAFSLRKQIQELGGVTERRARFIARDQVEKLNAAITEARQTRVGITHYFWRTSQDERVRDSHAAKEGDRFAWSSPPADTGHPGQDYNCRCTAEPDLSGVLGSGANLVNRAKPRRSVVAGTSRAITVGRVAQRIRRARQARIRVE